ncbi:hypothetical protein L6164_011944 [Bauhinia variegata]|uniref:Uncharacterized protein n=1 Tax=Bauhinia variegata TaxID=167791 RepID=A0ACB9P7Z4_BAUVA|nr:hypothetical protein L6164_011944 [Bauhinia variegata]
MEALQQISSVACLLPNVPKMMVGNGIRVNCNPGLIFANGHHSFSSSFSRQSVSLIVRARKNNKKEDTHSFVPKPDEATGFFPEAVLLKQKKVQEDGQLLPEFADAEEKQLYESLMLELESDMGVDQTRHYEVVYLIHEKHAEEVADVNEKIQTFLREKKGRVWRLNDWGMRRLAYQIKKAKNANYILMNFELDAKYINEFKSLLDKDERVIRHLVIKMDEAVTEDCPPPPEFHTLRSNMYDDDEEEEYEDDDWDEEDEMDGYDDDDGDEIIVVDVDDDDEGREYSHDTIGNVTQPEIQKLRAEKVGR